VAKMDEEQRNDSDIQGMEEAYYHWVINDICDLINTYGYNKVISDIEDTLVCRIKSRDE
jgi:hypothetical protein